MIWYAAGMDRMVNKNNLDDLFLPKNMLPGRLVLVPLFFFVDTFHSVVSSRIENTDFSYP